jgi:hypothetical protein
LRAPPCTSSSLLPWAAHSGAPLKKSFYELFPTYTFSNFALSLCHRCESFYGIGLEVNSLFLILTWTLFSFEDWKLTNNDFFGGKILHLGNKNEKGVAHGTKGGIYFCGKIGPLSPHYEEKWAHVAIFRQLVVLACHQHALELLNFFSFFFI